MRLGDIIGLIQCSFNFLWINGRMALLLFHTREWWQHEFLVNVMTVIHEVNTGAVREKCAATFFLNILSAIFSYIRVTTPRGRISINIQAGGYALLYFSLKCRINSSLEFFSSLSTNTMVLLNFSAFANIDSSVIQKILSVVSATMFANALRRAISIFSISLKRNNLSFLSKQ